MDSVDSTESEAEDFNKALDNLFDLLSDDCTGATYDVAMMRCTPYCETTQFADDEELQRAQETYNRLTADAGENDVKRMKYETVQSIPKIMKNDIRRYYSRMFMNTLNSADFINLQDYFNTFMSGPCKFVAKHVAQPELELPDVVTHCGPRQMSHFCLGCLVMYPDTVMSMSDSKIVTSNSWSGSQIVMDVQIKGTKMYDIEMESWVPQLATLDACYEAALNASAVATIKAIENVCEPCRDTAACSYTAAEVSTADGENAGAMNAPYITATTDVLSALASGIWDASSVGLVCGATAESANTDAPRSTLLKEPTSSITSLTLAVITADCGSTGSSNVAHVSAITTTPHTPTLPHITNRCDYGTIGCTTAASEGQCKRKTNQLGDSSSCITKGSTDSTVSVKGKRSAPFTYIPEAFVQSLFARAKRLPKPIPLVLQGQITMYLDESNHIRLMSESFVQKFE